MSYPRAKEAPTSGRAESQPPTLHLAVQWVPDFVEAVKERRQPQKAEWKEYLISWISFS